MLLERGIDVSYETVRRWTAKFGPQIARNLRRSQRRPGDIWHLDEVVAKISGKTFWLWRAALTIRYHRMEALRTWRVAASIA